MTQKSPSPKDDPVWDLLRKSSRPTPSAQFIDQAVKTARLEAQNSDSADEASRSIWWRQVFSWQTGLAVGGLVTAAAAAVVLLIIAINHPAPTNAEQQAANSITKSSEQSKQSTGTLEILNDTVATETLSFAADHPDAFSDAELVTLIIQ